MKLNLEKLSISLTIREFEMLQQYAEESEKFWESKLKQLNDKIAQEVSNFGRAHKEALLGQEKMGA